MSNDELSALWRHQWPGCPPLASRLKHAFRDRWVRFHSLPDSRRYPENDADYSIVLHRYNSILDDLFRGKEIRVVTTGWSTEREPTERHTRWHPDAHHWMSLRTNEDEADPDFVTYTHLFVGQMEWRPGVIDDLLRAVAEDATSGVMITSLSFDRIHHPYDGGADVLLPTTVERDAMKHRRLDWLSSHLLGC